jgi:hypothetical protein
MATVPPQTSSVARGVRETIWASLGNTDDGGPLIAPDFPRKSIHVLGTWGAGGELTLEGSNQQTITAYQPVHDRQGNAIVLSAAAPDIEDVVENPRALRPRVSGGDGTTDLTVIVVSESTRR